MDQQQYWDRLYTFLQQFVPLSKDEFSLWQPFFEIRKFDKKELILKESELEDYVNLVVQGLARKYIIIKKGEATTQIAPEGHVIQSELSFHYRKPSTVNIEAIEPTIFISIHYDNLQKLYSQFPDAEKMGRLFITNMFIVKDQHHFEMLKKATRQRFLDYIKTHPYMLQRVPQKYLASYLNIKPETFSRLKHLLKK